MTPILLLVLMLELHPVVDVPHGPDDNCIDLLHHLRSVRLHTLVDMEALPEALARIADSAVPLIAVTTQKASFFRAETAIFTCGIGQDVSDEVVQKPEFLIAEESPYLMVSNMQLRGIDFDFDEGLGCAEAQTMLARRGLRTVEKEAFPFGAIFYMEERWGSPKTALLTCTATQMGTFSEH